MSADPTPPALSTPDARGSQHAVDLVRHRRQVTKRQLRKQTTLRIEALANLDVAPGLGQATATPGDGQA